jgi:2'-5' RNA ligase
MTVFWIEAPLLTPRDEMPIDLHLPDPPFGLVRVPRDKRHLTLCYLGDIPPDKASECFWRALLVVGREGFTIRAKTAAFFGEVGEALVIRLDPAMRKAMRQVRKAARPLAGPEIDRWSPNPHVTFAMAKGLSTPADHRAAKKYAALVSASVREVPLHFGPFVLKQSERGLVVVSPQPH